MPSNHEPDSGESVGVTCDMSAIPADQRDAHIQLAKSVLFGAATATDIDGGIQFDLSASHLADVARFVENERRCCPHLQFAIDVPPRSDAITLRVTGPLAREELTALAQAR